MRIAISGASGFVGRALTEHLRALGHSVAAVGRRSDGTPDAVRWDPATGTLVPPPGPLDAFVHLAGESVAHRWTPARRRAIADSRGPATERLCRTLAALPQPPRVLVSASAIGVFGDRGDEELDERSGAGTGFLADVARAWEAGTAPLQAVGTRVVHLRIGIVLDPRGGALARMLPPFRLGLGGPLGTGRQWMSWITLADLLRAITFCIDHRDLQGPVNAVGPAPVTNRDFTKALGQALRRPAFLPAPAFALRLLFGAMADGVLLGSQRVLPRALQRAGFAFEHATIGAAFAALLARRGGATPPAPASR